MLAVSKDRKYHLQNITLVVGYKHKGKNWPLRLYSTKIPCAYIQPSVKSLQI